MRELEKRRRDLSPRSPWPDFNLVLARRARIAGLERQPVVLFGEFHVAGIDAEPQADAEADRDQHDIAPPQIAAGKPADDIGIAFRCREPADCRRN